jgi:hypothetical protein
MTPFKSYELKIKARSLALENQLIHQNESRLKRQISRAKKSGDERALARLKSLRETRDSLREHRKRIVRPISRSANLAYGFLKGRSYVEMEQVRYTDPHWDAIAKMILKHGKQAGDEQALMQNFERWKQEAPPLAVHKAPSQSGVVSH